jgi:hypothetical protein
MQNLGQSNDERKVNSLIEIEDKIDFIVDSGAFNHICNNPEFFSELKEGNVRPVYTTNFPTWEGHHQV